MKRRTGLNDTSPEAHRVHVELLRKAGPERRLQMGLSLSASVMKQARLAIRAANPALCETEVGLRFVELNYGKELAAKVRAPRPRHRCSILRSTAPSRR